MKRLVVLVTGVALVLSCRRAEIGSPLGATYERIARPTVWRVLPHGQAESLGLKPGDAVLSYNDVVVKSNDDLLQLESELTGSTARVPLTILRGDQELTYAVLPGTLGYMPESERYSASLAVALEDILGHFGVEVEYDWLAALTGESFSFTAMKNVCPGTWPGAISATYLEDAADAVGLSLRPIFDEIDSVPGDAVGSIRTALGRGRVVLVRGGWPETRGSQWGIATHYDNDDSLLYGYTTGSADELPLTGSIREAYEVRLTGRPDLEPGLLLSDVLVQGLELGQAYSDSGWQSGIAAYDIWIDQLDSVPFCRQCSTQSEDCFSRLVWSLRAHKESENRFLADMREALTDQADLIDEISAYNSAILGKLDGIIQSGVDVGTIENQRKLVVAISEIELLETDLLAAYEDLIGEL